MINKVTLIGHLGKDPELRRLESGVAVAKFSVATNESYKDQNGNWQNATEWHDVLLWRHLAERAETQLRKGMLVYLDGKLTTRQWQDKEGQSRRTTEVVASYFRVLNRRDGQDSSYQADESTPDTESHDAEPQENPGITLSPKADTSSQQSAAPSSDNANDESDLPF